MQHVKELDNRFYIAESTQKGAGDGLFAKVDLKENDCLEIIGVIAESKKCVKYANSHSFVTQEGECWIPLGFGAIVNHASDPSCQNVVYTFYEEMPVFICTSNIKEGDEILTSYGSGFANVLATYLSLEATGNLVEWQQECEDISNSEEGAKLYEKLWGNGW